VSLKIGHRRDRNIAVDAILALDPNARAAFRGGAASVKLWSSVN
jgi:hypothetical protein